MSKTIEWDGTDEGLAELDDDDLKYLHDRNRITDEQWAAARDFDEDELQPSTDLSKPPPVEEVANTGDANTSGLTKAQVEHRQKRMAREQADAREAEESEAIVAPEDYADAKNDDLRAEIARRNEDRDEDDQLPLTGNKAALIAVLEEDDEAEADEDEE